MECSIPKRVFAFIETKPEEDVYEICIPLTSVRKARFCRRLNRYENYY